MYLTPKLDPDIPEAPTDEDVSNALRLLAGDVFGDFPLGGGGRGDVVAALTCGKSLPEATNALAFLLVPFVRETITGPPPFHLVNKPAARTGGTYFVKGLTSLVAGEAATEFAFPKNRDELDKTLVPILQAGSTFVNFDNVGVKVASPALASAGTSFKFGGRVQGKSETVEIPVRAIWIWSGINITMSNEIRRRCVLIDMDSGEVDPTSRNQWRHENLDEWVMGHRAALVRACLVLIQNWIARGQPEGGQNLKSYTGWSKVLGGILDAGGVGGFLANGDKLRDIGFR